MKSFVQIECPACQQLITLPFDAVNDAPSELTDPKTIRVTLRLRLDRASGCEHADLLGGDETTGMTLAELLSDAEDRLARIEKVL